MYHLTDNTPPLSQKAVLTVSSNKKQLMSIICSGIINDEELHAQHTTRNKLVITGSGDIPTEIHKGVVIAREDIATSHEEADNIIAQQAIMCAKEHSGATVVVADDTDVFILLLFHYLNEHLTCPMFMISPIQHDHLSTLRKFIGACYGNRIGEKRRSPISDTRSGQRSLEIQQLQPLRYKHCRLLQKLS